MIITCCTKILYTYNFNFATFLAKTEHCNSSVNPVLLGSFLNVEDNFKGFLLHIPEHCCSLISYISSIFLFSFRENAICIM